MKNEIIKTVTAWYDSGESFGQSSPNLTITATNNTITITLNRNKLVADNFRSFIRDLDDDLFLEVCEELGNENVVAISNALDSGDKIHDYIALFKNTLSEIITDKFNYYKECIEKYTNK